MPTIIDDTGLNQDYETTGDGVVISNILPNISTGTGIYGTFLSMQNSPTESGFNTDGSPLPLDDKRTTFTNALPLGTLNYVAGDSVAIPGTQDGVIYYMFRLDINQSTPQISLDQLQIYQASTGTIATLGDLTSQGTLKYDLGDKTVLLSDWNDGSGKGDYVFYVPISYFDLSKTDGTYNSPYVYLYSTFGGAGADYTTNGGFEEWGAFVSPPAPSVAIDKVTADLADGTTVTGTPDDGITVLSGENVEWIYTVVNNGGLAFSGSNVTVVDNNGTVGTTSDDRTATAVLNGSYNVGDVNQNGMLDPGEEWQYALTGTAITGSYANIATVTATDGHGHNAVSVTGQDDSSYFGADPGIAIAKTTQDTTSPAGTAGDGINVLVGDSLTWTYTVTNTGNVALSDVTVTDDNGTVSTADDFTATAVLGADAVHNIGDTDTDGKLDTTETWVFTATGTAAAGTYSNTGTAAGSFTDDAGHVANPSATDTSGYFGANAQIAIVKTTQDTTSPAGTAGDGINVLVGDGLKWAYTVTNTGNVALSDVTVTDDNGTAGTADDFNPTAVLGTDGVHNIGDTNTDGKLDTTETWQFTYTGTAVAGSYSNTGTAAGSYTDTAGHVASPSAHDHSSYFGANAQIAIDKKTQDTASPAGTAGDGIDILTGESLKWIYTVTNPGNVALSDVSISDNNGTTGTTADDFSPDAVLGADAVHNIGDTNTDGKLDTTETWLFTATGTAAEGAYNNIATAGGSYSDDAGHTANPSANDTSSYFGASPGISIDKKTNGLDDGGAIAAGGVVIWTYDVTNTGNVALANLVVTDDNGTPANLTDDWNPAPILNAGGHNTGDTNNNGVFDPGEIWHFSQTGTAISGGVYTNIATATTNNYADDAGHSVPLSDTDSSGYYVFSNKPLTQGFWGSHSDAWDGNPANASKPTLSAVKGGVLSAAEINPSTRAGYLLLGDTNANGQADDAHDLWISNNLAKAILSSSTTGDARIIFMQQAIATQLNIDNGAPQPINLIDDAVQWMTNSGTWAGAGVDLDPDDDGTINGSASKLAGTAVSTSGDAWHKYVTVTTGVMADGEGLKNALAYYNQGQLVVAGGSVGWFNGSTLTAVNPNTIDQFWVTLSQTPGTIGITH